MCNWIILKAEEKWLTKSWAWQPLPSRFLKGKWSRVTVASSSFSWIFRLIEVNATGLKSFSVVGRLDLGTGTTTASFHFLGTWEAAWIKPPVLCWRRRCRIFLCFVVSIQGVCFPSSHIYPSARWLEMLMRCKRLWLPRHHASSHLFFFFFAVSLLWRTFFDVQSNFEFTKVLFFQPALLTFHTLSLVFIL